MKLRILTLSALLTMLLGLAACGSPVPLAAPTPALSPDLVWEEPIPFDSDSDSIYQENLHLFDYDQQAPLEIQEVDSWRDGATTVYDITYASPKGGRVPATLIVPDGTGPFAGIVVQHGMPSNRQGSFFLGRAYANLGAVVILIDAPFARPENADRESLTLTEQDREEQIQLIVDLRRAVDLLVARADVDPDRLAYIGVSYGAAMGGLLAGVEHRLQAYVLQVGDGGLVTHLTGPEDQDSELSELSEEEREGWIAAMWPIEPIHYVGHAAPAALLFQNGTQDQMVPPADAVPYQEAGSEPKTIMWYESGHFLPPQSLPDQAEWLHERIGIQDPDEIVGELILLKPVKPLMLLVPSIRQSAPMVDRLLLGWFLLVAGSLAFLIWDLWRGTAGPGTIKLIWPLVVVFFGPLGLLAYFISHRQPARSPSPRVALTTAKRALGSTSWSVAGNLAGGLLVIWILATYPSVGAVVLLSLLLVVALPFSVGLLIFHAVKWGATRNVKYRIALRRPPLAEFISTNMVLAGVYPVVTVLIDRWLNPWYPLGFGLANPLLWSLLSLGAIAGAVIAYPVHIWMIRRGLVQWGLPLPAAEDAEPLEPEAPKLPRFEAVGITLLTCAVLVAGIIVSLMLA